jgi:hypothetical protein
MIQLARRQLCCMHMSEESSRLVPRLSLLTEKPGCQHTSERLKVEVSARHQHRSKSQIRHVVAHAEALLPCRRARLQCQSKTIRGALGKRGAHHADISIIRKPGVLHEHNRSYCPPALTAYKPLFRPQQGCPPSSVLFVTG